MPETEKKKNQKKKKMTSAQRGRPRFQGLQGPERGRDLPAEWQMKASGSNDRHARGRFVDSSSGQPGRDLGVLGSCG